MEHNQTLILEQQEAKAYIAMARAAESLAGSVVFTIGDEANTAVRAFKGDGKSYNVIRVERFNVQASEWFSTLETMEDEYKLGVPPLDMRV